MLGLGGQNTQQQAGSGYYGSPNYQGGLPGNVQQYGPGRLGP